MGKKSHNNAGKTKHSGTSAQNNLSINRKNLSPQKRNEINQLVDKILKVSSNVPSNGGLSKEWEAYEEIQKLLFKVKAIEKELYSPLPPRKSCLEEFENWLKQNGALMEGLSIAEFPNVEFGLLAQEDFKQGDLLMAIPRDLMLTLERVQTSCLGSLASKDPLLQNMPNVAFALLILIESLSANSFWKPYLNILPRSYTTVLYFTPENMQELKGSPTFEVALRQCRNIARQYAYFNKLFQNESDPASSFLREIFTYDLYCWAVSTVMTRQNSVPFADKTGTSYALIPLWDLSNHEEGQLSTDFIEERNRCECLAWRKFTKGSQVFIHYGDRPNSVFMVHNGFVYPNNSHDFVYVRLGVARADPLYAEKAALLAKLSLPVSAEWDILQGERPVSKALVAFIRIFNMNKEQLQTWTNSDRLADLLDEDKPLDLDSETRSWRFLSARINLLLRAYPTKLQDDELLLSDPKLSSCAKLAVQLRYEEKKILEKALSYADLRCIFILQLQKI